jgi:hypothetical protein
VKQHRADRDQKQYVRDNHPSLLLAIKGNGDESKGGARICLDGRLHMRHRSASCLAHFDRSRHQNVARSTRYDR